MWRCVDDGWLRSCPWSTHSHWPVAADGNPSHGKPWKQPRLLIATQPPPQQMKQGISHKILSSVTQSLTATNQKDDVNVELSGFHQNRHSFKILSLLVQWLQPLNFPNEIPVVSSTLSQPSHMSRNTHAVQDLGFLPFLATLFWVLLSTLVLTCNYGTVRCPRASVAWDFGWWSTTTINHHSWLLKYHSWWFLKP